MAFYTVAFQGAIGTGALALGAVAQTTSLKDGLVLLAVGTLAPFASPCPSPVKLTSRPPTRRHSR